jgi:hypothetical protein
MSQAGPNWMLFYRTEAGVPREFYELRRVGSTLWTRTGKVETWGTGGPAECSTPEEAEARFREAWTQREAEGWVLTRQGEYDPARFDGELLKAEIREGTRQAFQAVRAAHPGVTLNAFALVSDESAMTIGPMASSREALKAGGGGDDLRFNPDEWPYTQGGEYLDIAYRLILPRQQDVPQELPFEEFRERVFEAAVGALEDLDQEGLFGTGEAREEFFLLLHVTDADPLEDAIRRLNPAATWRRYQKWGKSWK